MKHSIKFLLVSILIRLVRIDEYSAARELFWLTAIVAATGMFFYKFLVFAITNTPY